jgi:tetratricopeptide (TPR) repeat protein
MPRYGASDIPHTAATDHRILRGGKASSHEEAPASSGDGFPMVSFYRGRQGVEEEEEDRSRAVAVVTLALTGDPAAAGAVSRALPLLEAAVVRDPNDLAAGEARGYALVLLNRPSEGLAAFQPVLARAPERELALMGSALATESLGQTEAALGWWRRAVAVNPWAVGYRHRLVPLLIKKEAWDEAGPQCEAWLRLDPLSAEARTAHVQCLLAAGARDEARAEFARIEALAPSNLRDLQIRFAKKLR